MPVGIVEKHAGRHRRERLQHVHEFSRSTRPAEIGLALGQSPCLPPQRRAGSESRERSAVPRRLPRSACCRRQRTRARSTRSSGECAGKHADAVVDAFGPSSPRRYSGLPTTTKGKGGASRTATISAAMNWPILTPASNPSGREVDQFLACGDLHLDLGKGLAEGGDQGFEQDRHHRARHGEAQHAGRSCPRSRTTSPAATSSSKAGFARDRNRSRLHRPTLRVVRMKSAAPTRASSVRTAWLIADGVTPSARPLCESCDSWRRSGTPRRRRARPALL